MRKGNSIPGQDEIKQAFTASATAVRLLAFLSILLKTN
jgi:hypothetical protein